jgi:hypothetical protein
MAASEDCSSGLSREHYISRVLLDGLDLRIRGFPWQREQVARVSPDNLTAKILCRRHNSALSPLDTAAKDYFRSLEKARIHAVRRSLSTCTGHFLVSGDGLELWAMKTLAGLYASKIEFTTPEYRFRDFEPPMRMIVEQLSSRRPRSIMTMSIPVAREGHESSIGRRAVSVGPMIEGDPPELVGLMIRMHGLALLFRIGGGESGSRTDEVIRPDIIDLHGRERTARMFLSWGEPRREGRIFEMRLARGSQAREREFTLERQAVIDRLQAKSRRTDRVNDEGTT